MTQILFKMGKTKQKKIFLLGSYHGNNFGDLEILDTILSKLYRDYSISIFTKSAFKIKTKLPIQYFEEGNISFVKPYNLVKVFINILRADAVIIGGGGLFFSYSIIDTLRLTAKSQLLYWINVTIIAKIFRKKVFWYGVGFGPFDKFGEVLTLLTSKIVNKIYPRDEYSFNLLKEKLKSKKLFETSDVVFSKVETRKVKKFFEKKSAEINNVLMFLFEKDNEKQLVEILNYLAKENLKVTIVSSNPNKDNKFNQKLSKICKTNFIDISNLSLQEFRNLFSKYDLVISMRMHPLLIGFQQGLLGIGLSDGISKVEELQKQLYRKNLFSDKYNIEEQLSKIKTNKITLKQESIQNYEEYFQSANLAFDDLIKELAEK